MTEPITAEPLRSETYRDELTDVSNGTHDETGPQPTVDEIEAVLADLDAPTEDTDEAEEATSGE